MMSVAIKAGSGFSASAPTQLFESNLLETPNQGTSYDVAPDGRFLLNRIVDRTSPPLVVVTDWRAGVVK
jgi:hypothetical protein